MAKGNFDACNMVTLKYEGGYVNNPNDPGGRTNYGVTERVYHSWLRSRGKPVVSVKFITKQQVHDIYYENYWMVVGGESLPYGVDLAVYDAAVNSGPARAKKWLAASCAGSGYMDPQSIVKRVCGHRLSFVRSLRTWRYFGKGWLTRIANIEAIGVSWALRAVGHTPQQVRDRLIKDSNDATRSANNNRSTAVASGVTSTTSGVGYSYTPGPDVLASLLLFVLFIVGLGITVYLLHKARTNRAKAEAYNNEAATQ